VWRNHWCAVIGLLPCSVGVATAADRPNTYDEMIARQAEIHGVPEALVHRIVKRESRISQASSIAIALALCRSNMRRRAKWAIRAMRKAFWTQKSTLLTPCLISPTLSSRRRR